MKQWLLDKMEETPKYLYCVYTRKHAGISCIEIVMHLCSIACSLVIVIYTAICIPVQAKRGTLEAQITSLI